jgi:UDP-N-acetylmuramate dehydrogenase
VVLTAKDLRFGYRDSALKQSLKAHGATPRWVVLDVEFSARVEALSAASVYAELARALNVPLGSRLALDQVRQCVLALRRSKGMVLNQADHDTWSCGSFFTNPVLTADAAARLPQDAPRYPAGGSLVKTSAAWLIAHSGMDKGWGVNPELASLSTKHVLAVTNRGSAQPRDIAELAGAVRANVASHHGVILEVEPTLAHLDLPAPPATGPRL